MATDHFTKIKNQLPYLNPALQRIGEFILQNQERCKTITIKDLASSCSVAESTVTRFVKELDFKNFQELKIALTEFVSVNEASPAPVAVENIYEDISKTDTTPEIIDKIFFRNIQKMTICKDSLHIPAINKAVSLLKDCHQIFFVCTGSSAVAGEEAVMRFTRAGKYCTLWKDASLQRMSAAIVSANDVMIGISDSGKTKTVLETMNIAKENGAHLIAITSDPDSRLASMSDVTLFFPEKSGKTQSALHWESTSSKTAQIFIIDVLYACFAVQTYDNTMKNLDKTYKAIKQTREE